MSVDYNNFAKTFSNSRKNMKWEEIDYFINSYLGDSEWKWFLDIWCWSWRLLEQFSTNFNIDNIKYLWLDLSDKMLKHAKDNFSDKDFLNLNMLDLDKLKWQKFDFIFFIASFHHLDNLEDRLNTLSKVIELLKENWKIFMTNWALNSEINKEKYTKDIIKNSKNKFWSLDYNIMFREYSRYYHCFNLSELEYLFTETWFEIIENREFENKRNFVSIIRKK